MRIGGMVMLTLGLGMAAPGCMSNACYVQTCDGPYCRCTVSTCGPGAAWDSRVSRCRCKVGYVVAGGQCLRPQQAAATCGRGYHLEGSGCVADRCRPGDELDQATGLCIPHEQVNRVAKDLGIPVGTGQKLGCPAGQKLVVDGATAACIPLSETCARDERWNGTACAKVEECEVGASWDSQQGRCVPFAKASTEEGRSVDVSQWARTTYGPDGGAGATGFCGAFTKKPWSFGVTEGSTVMIRISVATSFPDGQIANGAVKATTVFAASGKPVPPKGADEVDAATFAAFKPLVHQGGKATAATVATSVTCTIANAAKPQAVPATGGL